MGTAEASLQAAPRFVRTGLGVGTGLNCSTRPRKVSASALNWEASAGRLKMLCLVVGDRREGLDRRLGRLQFCADPSVRCDELQRLGLALPLSLGQLGTYAVQLLFSRSAARPLWSISRSARRSAPAARSLAASMAVRPSPARRRSLLGCAPADPATHRPGPSTSMRAMVAACA